MPEGHTIHRIARDHAKLLVGPALVASSPQGRFDSSAALLDGRRLAGIEAYGKHLFYDFEHDLVLHVHLGLFGKYRVHRTEVTEAPPPPRGAVRLRLSAPTATIDLAGPTACELGTPDDRDAIVARLGPDPLRADAKAELAVDRMARSRAPIGALLLDQSVLSGIGNVYRAEALFVHGLDPRRSGRTVAPETLTELWDTMRTMLRNGVKDGRIVTVDPAEVGVRTRTKVPKGERTYVYHQDLCRRCGTAIVHDEIGARTCWWCPSCQPAP